MNYDQRSLLKELVKGLKTRENAQSVLTKGTETITFTPHSIWYAMRGLTLSLEFDKALKQVFQNNIRHQWFQKLLINYLIDSIQKTYVFRYLGVREEEDFSCDGDREFEEPRQVYAIQITILPEVELHNFQD